MISATGLLANMFLSLAPTGVMEHFVKANTCKRFSSVFEEGARFIQAVSGCSLSSLVRLGRKWY